MNLNLSPRTGTWLIGLAGSLLLAWAALPWVPLEKAPPPRGGPRGGGPGSAVSAAGTDPVHWTVFAPAPGPPRTVAASRFRLAGTFRLFASGDVESASAQIRQAVLDDLQEGRQALVSEGDRFGELEVRTVGQDWVDVEWAGQTERLHTQSAAASSPGPGPSPSRLDDLPALERSLWGRRIAEDRWLFNRKAVMDYYQDLLDHPERLAAMLQTMQPERDGGEIAGYRYDGKGEPGFFAAAGIRPGDVVRRVNSMRMVSMLRAEYMLREFLNDGLDTLVFELEREGQPVRNIYFVRE